MLYDIATHKFQLILAISNLVYLATAARLHQGSQICAMAAFARVAETPVGQSLAMIRERRGRLRTQNCLEVGASVPLSTAMIQP